MQTAIPRLVFDRIVEQLLLFVRVRVRSDVMVLEVLSHRRPGKIVFQYGLAIDSLCQFRQKVFLIKTGQPIRFRFAYGLALDLSKCLRKELDAVDSDPAVRHRDDLIAQ